MLGLSTTQEPDYKVLKRSKDFEIRQYPPRIEASTFVRGDFKTASEIGFKRIFKYISEKNEREAKIEMTAPVFIEKKNNGHIVSFVIPRNYSLDSTPEPLSEAVSIRPVDAKTVATYRFSMYLSEEKNQMLARKLRKWSQLSDDYKVASSYYVAGYNPPWTIPFLRRNEVMIDLYKKAK